MNTRSNLLRAGIALALATAGGGAWAQTSERSTTVLEEITVTAQKRAESLQATPLAVTALTSTALEDKQILTVEGLQHLVPNLYMEQALSGTTTPKMFLRGVGVDNQVFSFDSPIGIYVDGVYIARVTGALTDLNDVERVEFLRGPQGTLYGRNSSVGAMHIIHRAPTLDEPRGEVALSIGTNSQLNARFSASAALVQDKVGFSISAETRKRNGFMRDVNTNARVMDEDITSARAALLIKASDALSITLRADMMLDHSLPTVGSGFLRDTNPDPNVVDDRNPDGDIYTFENSPDSRMINKVEPKGVSGTIEWKTDNFDLTSITAYRELKYRNAGDVDGRAAVRSFEVDRQDLDQNQFTQEVYLSSDHLGGVPLTWTAGAFYFHEQDDFYWALRVFAPPTTQVFDQKTEAAAAYMQGTYPITDKFRLTAGLRYTSESKKMHAVQYLPTNTVPTQDLVLNPNFNFNDEIKTNRTNWHAALDYSISDAVMMYANAGTGFRSGGFNGSARDIASITSGAFGPESSFMAEGGVKADLFDRRLRLNALYYYADYKDLQLSIVNPDGTITAGNVQANTQGIEAEITWVPVDALQFTASVGTIADDIKDSPRELKDSPSVQYRIGALYRTPIGADAGTFSIGGDMSYSSQYFNDTNNASGTEAGPYHMWNGYMTYQTANKHWTYTLAGYNLSDLSYPNHTFNIANGFISGVQFPITPRRWLLTAQYNF